MVKIFLRNQKGRPINSYNETYSLTTIEKIQQVYNKVVVKIHIIKKLLTLPYLHYLTW